MHRDHTMHFLHATRFLTLVGRLAVELLAQRLQGAPAAAYTSKPPTEPTAFEQGVRLELENPAS